MQFSSESGFKGTLLAYPLAARVGRNRCYLFAKIVTSLRTISSSQGKRGALSSTCNATVGIFKITSVIPPLVLVGVAVGFVLLRIEAAFE